MRADRTAKHTPSLLPGITRIADGAAMPEIREHAAEAQRVLTGASEGGDPLGTPAEQRVVADEALARDMLLELVVKETGLTPAVVRSDTLFSRTLDYISVAIAQLVRQREFDDAPWSETYVGPYLARFLPAAKAAGVASEMRKRWLTMDLERNKVLVVDGEEEEGEELTNLPFSLAYGGLLLLNHTVLRLHRGRRYGVCGPNGAGKSTLLKAIDRHQIENFPEGLSTFYVECVGLLRSALTTQARH